MSLLSRVEYDLSALAQDVQSLLGGSTGSSGSKLEEELFLLMLLEGMSGDTSDPSLLNGLSGLGGNNGGGGNYQLANYTPSSSTSVGSGQPVGKTANAASLAEQYLGWGEPQLQADRVDDSAPYGESCADFVSSMLQKSGLINWHTNLVANLATQLPAQGWTQVPLADAKPGDVWICDGANGESHTEIVASNNNGHVTLIGSNNVSSDMQQVSYDSYSASIPGSYILAPP
jgi:hypothetical protein